MILVAAAPLGRLDPPGIAAVVQLESGVMAVNRERVVTLEHVGEFHNILPLDWTLPKDPVRKIHIGLEKLVGQHFSTLAVEVLVVLEKILGPPRPSVVSPKTLLPEIAKLHLFGTGGEDKSPHLGGQVVADRVRGTPLIWNWRNQHQCSVFDQQDTLHDFLEESEQFEGHLGIRMVPQVV